MIILQSGPHPALEKQVAQYLYLSLDKPSDMGSLKQEFFPFDLPAICFYFSNTMVVEKSREAESTFARGVYTGLITSPAALSLRKDEKTESFIIIFKPYGFAELFALDSAELTDQVPDFFSIQSAEATALYERLGNATTFEDRVHIMNGYLLKKLPRFDTGAPIREACRQILLRQGIVEIKHLAYESNMSLRSFERQFTRRVGVTPKTFARIKRFHHSLSYLRPGRTLSLAQIAFSCGFYDQAHFTREFQDFTGKTPFSFRPQDYALFRQFIVQRNYYRDGK